jgi:tetratricopeptide (TPR) repeat protein
LRRLLLAATLAFVAHRALAPMAETDLFFHLKIGQLIVADHHIPFRNLFSFTYPDYPDPDMSWAFQVLVALVYRIGGFAAIVLVKAGLITAAAALGHRAARRSGAGPLACAGAVMLALLVADQRLVERPHLVTFVGIGALLAMLAEIENGRERLIWWLPALTLLWANFHAGVFFAPLVLGLYIGGSKLDGLPVRRLLYVWPLVAVATVLTPAGLRLLSYLGWHTGVGSSRDIEEFRHVEPWSDPWYFVMLAVCVVGVLAPRRRTGWRRVLPIVVVAILAAQSVRFAAEWGFLCIPFCALSLDALRIRGSARVQAVAAAAIAALIFVERLGKPLRIGLADDIAPREAIAFVTQHGLRDRMYVDLDLGCYLLWEGWPRYRVFQDARLPAYPHEFHRALDHTPPSEWDALLSRYGVDAALVNYPGINYRAGSFNPETWALVWRTRDALVFARRTDSHRDLIARYEIPLRMRFEWTTGTHIEPIPAPPPLSPVPLCEWYRRLADALDNEGDPAAALEAREAGLIADCLTPLGEIDVRFRIGARAQLRGQMRAALTQYDRVLFLQPDHVDALVNRGFARLMLGDREGARADFEHARKLDPKRPELSEGLRRVQ